MGLIDSLLVGVISGLVASITYALLTKAIRPNIVIADIAIKNNERGLFIVKIINRSKNRITDVSCSLQYYQALSNGYRMIDCKPYVGISPIIEGYVNDKDDMNAPSLYAVQYGFFIPEKVKCDAKDKIVFLIKGVHPVSGTASYSTKEYRFGYTGQVKDDMLFDAGDNMGIHEMKE